MSEKTVHTCELRTKEINAQTVQDYKQREDRRKDVYGVDFKFSRRHGKTI